MTVKDAYEILGIAPGTEPDEIKKKYRQLMLRVHPDVQDGPGETYRYSAGQINLAYALLKKYLSKSVKESVRERRGDTHGMNAGEYHSNSGSTYSGETGGPQRERRSPWDAPVNEYAYMAREVYHYVEDRDGEILGKVHIATGKYLWKTEEDFPLFLLSLYKCSRQLLDEIDGGAGDACNSKFNSGARGISGTKFNSGARGISGSKFNGGAGGDFGDVSGRSGNGEIRMRVQTELTYLLAQQFIDAAALLKELAREEKSRDGSRIYYMSAMLEYAGGGVLPEIGETLYPVGVRRHRLYLRDKSGQKTGYLSFTDDRLYYIVIPLFEHKRVQVRIRVREDQPGKREKNRKYRNLHLWLKPSDQNTDHLPESLNLQIAELLQKYREIVG